MYYAFLLDGKAILTIQVIKLSNIASTSLAIVRCEATAADTMQSLISSFQAFWEDYGPRFVGLRIMVILHDMISSIFLAASSVATYVRYIRVGKMMIMHQSLLSFVIDLVGILC